MLPRIPGVKTIAFTKCIIAFHHTFAAIGKKRKNKENNIVWHEGIEGRSATEITASFYTALLHEHSASQFILWADNCMSQNKNCYLFSCLTCLVNSSDIHIEDITIKFF